MAQAPVAAEPGAAEPAAAEPAPAPNDGNHNSILRTPPQSQASPDPTLPKGTVMARILDVDGRPMAGVQVTLGILENSVAKGESRRRELAVSDADGTVRWDNQSTALGMAYRVSVQHQGGQFAIAPFQLNEQQGVLAKLFLFPVVHDLAQTLVVNQTAIYFEIKDDRLQVEQVFAVGNFGRTAWVPERLVLQMPADLRAFTAQAGMSDIAVDRVDGGVQLRGTFTPGQHQVVFRWQLPYAGEREYDIELEMPPHLASARVLAAAARDMRLEVDTLPAAVMQESQGERILVTERDILRNEAPMKTLRVHLRNIPEAGLPSWLLRSGVGASSLLVGLALAYAWRSQRQKVRAKAPGELEGVRQQLLEQLEQIERAHRNGEIGPKTYERARRDLSDQLALTFAEA